jgi:hypothetical protein
MRQVLTWRFVAAVAAVLGLGLLVYVVQAQRSDEPTFADSTVDATRRMDLVSLVQSVEQSDFQMTPQGTVSGTLILNVMVGGQPVRVQAFPGTPGEVACENFTDQYQCVVLAQTLGDTLVWFALVPVAGEFRFRLPAIDDLEDGYAHLVNGWEVPYAQTIDRSACDQDVASFGEFLNEHPGDFESVYDLTEHAIVAVVC